MVSTSCGAALGPELIIMMVAAWEVFWGILPRESVLSKHILVSRNNGNIYSLIQSKMRHHVQKRLK